VRDLDKQRAPVSPRALTNDPFQVVRDPRVRVVVDVMGGIEPAHDLVIEAMRRGKHVVSANKELLSTRGEELMSVADEMGVDLLFEASVAGGIPLIRPLKESLAGDSVRRVMGILNGTTNFILTRMSETGESFGQALEVARRLGYAEADPSADVGGHDAAAKLAIVASIAFNARVVAGDVERDGLQDVAPDDIAAAHELGYEVKLLAVAENEDGEVSARVHPAMIPSVHPLASVRDVFNAIFVEARQAGELMFYGRGAGGAPTASAVVGDIVEVARNMTSGGRSVGCTCYRDRARIRATADTRSRYYVVLEVLDQPGVLASIASSFARHGVSIASVRQEGFGDHATLVIVTHASQEGKQRATFAELRGLDVVKRVRSTMRVMGTPEV
jgi:homoserine dehydrogenase